MLMWLLREFNDGGYAERHRLSVYDGFREFNNGIFWVRQRGNGWGIWIKQHKGYQVLDNDNPDAPGEDNFLLVRIGKISVAIMTPYKNRGWNA